MIKNLSFFILLIVIFPLFPQEFSDTIWVTTSDNNEMSALLGVEFFENHQCTITHGYLKKGEETPYKQDSTDEQWYRVSEELIIIRDYWGEFIPLSIVNESGESYLNTQMGSEEIVLEEISMVDWNKLKEEYALTENGGN